ncbi:MAG: ABC transporter permease, partial [Bacteroidia bacterium]|nr:ABC transporter permease [Bacteroidia bacterium]
MEQAFDSYERIAQVTEAGFNEHYGGTFTGTTMTYPLSTTLMGDYRGQFKRISRTTFVREGILATDQLKVTRQGRFVDPAAAELFSFHMVSGPRHGLEQSQSLFISRSLAETLFGTDDPINRTVRLDNRDDVTITGVFEDFPENSEFYDHHYFAPWSLYLASNKWIEERAVNDWRNHFLNIYVEIPKGKTFAGVGEQIKGALQFAPEDMEGAKASGTHLYLYPMSKWHLHPPWLQTGEIEPVLMLKVGGRDSGHFRFV